MQTQYDLIILGGGCAGLSLASRLASLGPKSPGTLVLESRSRYVNDRTWCFWDTVDHRLSHLVSHKWHEVSLHAEERRVTVNCGLSPYQMIPSDSFYRHSQKALELSRNVHLVLDSHVLSNPHKVGGRWFVETPSARYSSAMIVDTRPRFQPKDGALLWQSFYGMEVESAEPVFNPACVDLMGFRVVNSASIPFTYVLPFSEHRALIEITVFAPHPIPPPELAHDLEDAVARHTRGAPVKLHRSEQGVLPMGKGAPRSEPDTSYVYAGLTSGGARASSGYAFQRIQRWADICAGLVGEGKLPVGHSGDPFILRALDHLFVSVLRENPSMAPSIFLSLFERAQAERIIRFMSDRGSLADYAMIAAALPMTPFLRQLLRELFSRLNLSARPLDANQPLQPKESPLQ